MKGHNPKFVILDEMNALNDAIDKMTVTLAASKKAAATSAQALSALDPDWDPLEHPRDVWGKFIEKTSGTYLYGRAKKATFKTTTKPVTVTLNPGDALYKTQGGNSFVLHGDGSLDWYFASGMKGAKTLPANSSTVATWVGKIETKDVTLLDYAPAVEVHGKTVAQAQVDLDNKALAYADALANNDTLVPGKGVLADGAVVYTSDGNPDHGFIIKHEGKSYFYADSKMSAGNATELTAADLPNYENFSVVWNASPNKDKAEKIKADIVEPPLQEWEKELLQNDEAGETIVPQGDPWKPSNDTVMFHGTLFSASSKFYEHNKTANSYLVITSDGTPWKIDKTGKMISGAQAVQYLHNYHDITDKVIKANNDVGSGFVAKVAGGAFDAPKENPVEWEQSLLPQKIGTEVLPASIADMLNKQALAVNPKYTYDTLDWHKTSVGYIAKTSDGFYLNFKGHDEPFLTTSVKGIPDLSALWEKSPAVDAVPTPEDNAANEAKKLAVLMSLPDGVEIANGGPGLSAAVKAGGMYALYSKDGTHIGDGDTAHLVYKNFVKNAESQGYAVFTKGADKPLHWESTQAKQATIDSLPDGTIIVDSGVGFGFVAKTDGVYALYDASGKTVPTGTTGAQSVFDNMLEGAKGSMDYKVYVKGGLTETKNLYWVEEPVGHWEDGIGNWVHAFDKYVKAPTVDDVKGKTPEQVAALPGSENGKFYKSPNGTHYYFPDDESYYAVAYKKSVGYETMFSASDKKYGQEFVSNNIGAIKNFEPYAPVAAAVSTDTVEYPFGSVFKNVTVYRSKSSDTVYLVKNAIDGGYTMYTLGDDGWATQNFNKAYYEKANGSSNPVLLNNFDWVGGPAPVTSESVPDDDMPTNTDYKVNAVRNEWRHYAEKVRAAFPNDAPSAEEAADGSPVAHWMVINTSSDDQSKQMVLRKHENGQTSWAKNGHAIPAPALAWDIFGAIADDTDANWVKAQEGESGTKSPKKGSWIKDGIVKPPAADYYTFLDKTKPIALKASPKLPAFSLKPAPKEIYYLHPAGPKMVLQPGDKLYQHNKVKESFLIVYPDGSALKYDKTGKVLNGHQQLAVLNKNYTDITWKAENYTDANPLEKAATKVKKATTKKAAYVQSQKPKDSAGKLSTLSILIPGTHVVDMGPDKEFYTWNPDTKAYGQWGADGMIASTDDTASQMAYSMALISSSSNHYVIPSTDKIDFVPEIGPQPAGSVIYNSKTSSAVWLVLEPNGQQVRYEKAYDGHVKSSAIFVDSHDLDKYWTEVTGPVYSTPAEIEKAKVLPSGIAEVTPDNAKVYKSTNNTYVVETYPAGVWTTTLYGLNGLKWTSDDKPQIKFTEKVFHEHSAWTLVYDGPSLGNESLEIPQFQMSSPGKTKYFESLPAGSEFVDNGPGDFGYVHNSEHDSYYQIFDSGFINTDSEPPSETFAEAKDKALYSLDGYPKYFIKPGTPTASGDDDTSIVDFKAGYVLNPGDKVYKVNDYEVVSPSGNYIASFTHYDPATKTASGKGDQSGPESQAGWTSYLNSNYTPMDTGAPEAPLVHDPSAVPQPVVIQPSAPKDFAAASVKVTSFFWYPKDSSTYTKGWYATEHKGPNGTYYMGQDPDSKLWFIETQVQQSYNHTVEAAGFKTLKDAKYWVDQHATKKPAKNLPVDPNAPQTAKVTLNGFEVFLPPASTVWEFSDGGASQYMVFNPYRGDVGIQINSDGSIGNYGGNLDGFLNYYSNATKIHETAVPEYTPPALPDVTLDANYDNPWSYHSAAMSALSSLDWTLNDATSKQDQSIVEENRKRLAEAVWYLNKYRDLVSGSEKSKATKALKGIVKTTAVFDYFGRLAKNEEIPDALAIHLVTTDSDYFKGTEAAWNVKYGVQNAADTIRKQVRLQSYAVSAKELTGKDIPANFFGTAFGQSMVPTSGMSLEEAKAFLTKQGFKYADGVTEDLVAPLLRSYLTAMPSNAASKAEQTAQKNLTYAQVIVAYKAWQAQKAAAAKPTKVSKKAAAKAKIDWAAAHVKAAEDSKTLRSDFLQLWPDGISSMADVVVVNAQVDWVNEHANLEFDVPKSTSPIGTWNSRVGIVAALTGSPLFAALAQTPVSDDATGVNTPSWEAFATYAASTSWYQAFLHQNSEGIDFGSAVYSDALTELGMDSIPAPNGFKSALITRLVTNAEKVNKGAGSIDIAAKKPTTKVADPTVLPEVKPEWANEYSWSIVGLALAGQNADVLNASPITNMNFGSSLVALQKEVDPATQSKTPLYMWSEVPTNDQFKNLVRFSRDPYGSDPVRTGVRQVLAHLAAQGYFAAPLAVTKTIDVGGWSYEGHFVPGDKVYKVGGYGNQLYVRHQSGAVYKVIQNSYGNGITEAPVDFDYWQNSTEGDPLYVQPVTIDHDYAVAHDIPVEIFDAYMEAASAKSSAALDYPGMTGVSKGESLIFMKKYLSSGPTKYKKLVDKIPSMPDGVLKYLHYSAKTKQTDPFDFVLLLDKHGQFDTQEMPDLVTYKTPEGAPWAWYQSTYGTSADSIYSSWSSEASLPAYEAVFGKSAGDSYLTYSEAQELSAVLSGEVKWTDPNAKAKKAATKGTLVFTEDKSKQYGGMHTKYAWSDQYGNPWMSKAFDSDPNAKARVDAEHYACEISRLFGFGAPESRIQPMKGSYAYVQLIAPAASGDGLLGIDWHDLPVELTAKAMTEHVLDWVISNHDTHEKNILLTPDKDDVFGIDKGQAFKFFPVDHLAEGYMPPGNGDPVWYDRIYKAIRTKAMPKADADKIVDTVLRKAAFVSDRHTEEYRKNLELALAQRSKFPYPLVTREKFIDALMERKAHTFEDFETLYKGLYEQAGWEWPGKAKDEYLPKKIGTAHVAVTPDFAADVLASHSQGQSLFFAGPELEDGHMVFFTTNAPDNSLLLRGETKLRKDADKVFTAWLQQHSIQKSKQNFSAPDNDYSTLFGLDDQYQYLLNYVMTVNHHAEDKEYNASTVSAAHASLEGLQGQIAVVEKQIKTDPLKLATVYNQKFITAEQQAAWLENAKLMVSDFEEVDAAHSKNIKTSFNKTDNQLVKPSYKPSAGIDTSGKPKILAGYKVGDIGFYKWSDGNYVKMVDGKYVVSDDSEFTKAAHEGVEANVGPETPKKEEETETQVSVANKVVSVKHQNATTYKGIFDGESLQFNQTKDSGGKGMTGMEYEIAYENIKVRYMPWNGSGVATAQEGLLRLEVSGWDGSAPAIESMLSVLRDTGLELSEASEIDLEILYWRRLAGIVGDRSDKHESKNKALLTAVSKIEGMPTKIEERDALRKAWEIFYGEQGVAKAVTDKTYLPVFASPRANPETAKVHDVGQPIWNRPSSGVTYKDIYNWTGGKMPRHSVTYQGNESGEVRMPKVIMSGGLLSTEERTRVVGWVEGGSSSEDQNRGSSAFNFFKQRQNYSDWDVIAEPTVYFRDSNYAYNNDHFGKIDYRATQANFGIEQTIHTGGVELMLKNYISIMDDVACIIIPSGYNHVREDMIKFYKSIGITEIRGIPIEERFVASVSDANKTVQKVWQQMFDRDKEGDA